MTDQPMSCVQASAGSSSIPSAVMFKEVSSMFGSSMDEQSTAPSSVSLMGPSLPTAPRQACSQRRYQEDGIIYRISPATKGFFISSSIRANFCGRVSPSVEPAEDNEDMVSSDQARLEEDAPDEPDERALFRLELRKPSGGSARF